MILTLIHCVIPNGAHYGQNSHLPSGSSIASMLSMYHIPGVRVGGGWASVVILHLFFLVPCDLHMCADMCVHI